jgi:HK97 family phage prohead protease
MTQKEIRCATLELRAEGSGSSPRIVGMAARCGSKTTIQRGLNEIIAPGAFKDSIANGDDVVLNFNHSADKICARTGAGTLRLRETDQGLLFDADVDPDISYVGDLYRSIKRGDISECSFQFSTPTGGDSLMPDPDEQGAMLRVLKSVRLWDVSAVTYPQYSGGVTNISARNVIAADLQQRAASALAGQEILARRQRAAALLTEHEAWKQQQVSAEMADIERLRTRRNNLFS